MSTTTIISENVHVKLQFRDEYRRFFFNRSCKFAELYEKVKTILSLKDDFIVKYQDEEGEWITISTDMELDTGLVLSNGGLFRLHIVLKNNENICEVNHDTTSNEEKPWKRCKREYKRGKRDCKKGMRRCKKQWKKWRDCDDEEKEGCKRSDECKKSDECKEEDKEGCQNECQDERSEGDCEWGRHKKWRKFRGGRGRFSRRHFDCDNEEGSSEGDTISGDTLLSLEEIKNQLETLKQNLALLREKSFAAKGEMKDCKMKMKEKRKNEPTDIDGIVALRKVLQEKKQAFWAIFREVKSTRMRIKKLHDLAETKN